MEVATTLDETGCLTTPAGQKLVLQVDQAIEGLTPEKSAQFFAQKHKLAKYCVTQYPSNNVLRDASILTALAANVSFVYQAPFFNVPGYQEYAPHLVLSLIPAFLKGGAAVQQWLDVEVAVYIDRLQNHPSRKKEYGEAAKLVTNYKQFVEKVIRA